MWYRGKVLTKLETTILIVTHKPYEIEEADENLYKLIAVGGNKQVIHYTFRDDTGDNIANKNSNYSELTALYWAWKNLKEDVIGLVHYRRHLMSPFMKDQVISQNELDELLENYDAILPKKRNYFVENTYNHYKNAHNIHDLDEVKNILNEYFPDYVHSFEKVMKEKKSHRFNMMIMKEPFFSDYCEWLFEILFELEKRIDISDYDSYQKRVYGFISERLLDVWLEKEKVNYIEVPFKYTERENWLIKGTKFLFRKFSF